MAQKRVDAVISRQTEISDDKNQRMVGHIVQVLIEWVSMETDLLLKGAAQILGAFSSFTLTIIAL